MAKKRKDSLETLAAPAKTVQIGASNLFDQTLIALFAILLFFPPFFRGMFFREEFVIVHMFTAIIFLLYYQLVFVKTQRKFLSSPLDYANLALVICYALSMLIAINKDLGVAFAWRQINYFMIYWLAANLVSSLKDVHRLLQVLYASGLVVAGITLGTMVGFWNYDAAFQDGIVQTTLQYKNAGAILLAALSYLGFYFWVKDSRTWMKVLYGIGNYIYMFIIFGSQSRAVWLLYPIFFAMLMAGFPNRKRLISIFNIILLSGLTFTLSSQAYQKVIAGTPSQAWSWLFTGFGVIAVVQYLLFYLDKIKVNSKVVAIVTVLVIAALLGGVGILQSKTGATNVASFLPKNIYEKIVTLSIKERNINERTYFWRDGIKMAKARPILGFGGGGWRSGYREYSSYHYNSNEEHNHFMKVLVETGILGLLAYLAIWVGFLIMVVKYLFKTPPGEEKSTVWLITVSSLALGVHSFFDFDLSLGAIAIVLWSLFGLARGIERLTSEPAVKRSRDFIAQPFWQKATVWAVALVFFLFSFSVMLSNSYFDNKQQDANAAISNFEKAATYNPFNGEIYANMAQAYAFLAQQNQSQADYQLALDNALKATQKQPADSRWHQLYSYNLFLSNNIGEALDETEKIIETDHFGPNSYEVGAKNYFQAGLIALLRLNNPEAAQTYFRKSAGMEQRVDKLLAKLTPEEKYLMTSGNGFNLKPTFYQSIGQAYTMLGEYKLAQEYFSKVTEINGEVLFWQGVNLEKLGQKEKAQALYQQAYQNAPELKDLYAKIINLLP